MNEMERHNCGQFDGEMLMSYIYGVVDGPAAARVEDHLVECESCRTEFADLSYGHFSVFEWNKLEFEPLATPAINIEYGKKRGLFAAFTETIAASGKWRIAVPAFAAFMIAVSGFAMYSGVFSNGTELAVDQPKVAASPVEKPKIARVIEKAAAEPEAIDPQPATEPRNDASEKAQAVTISVRPKPKRPYIKRSGQPVRTETLPSAMTVADAPVRLSDLEESQDNSPRLSDLFDETETS